MSKANSYIHIIHLSPSVFIGWLVSRSQLRGHILHCSYEENEEEITKRWDDDSVDDVDDDDDGVLEDKGKRLKSFQMCERLLLLFYWP